MNRVKVTHFISFSGAHLPATAENYAQDAARYLPSIQRLILFALDSKNDHDREAYALAAGQTAKIAAHSGRRALELRNDRRNAQRRANHAAYLDCGMKRVKGALGGVYYE